MRRNSSLSKNRQFLISYHSLITDTYRYFNVFIAGDLKLRIDRKICNLMDIKRSGGTSRMYVCARDASSKSYEIFLLCVKTIHSDTGGKCA